MEFTALYRKHRPQVFKELLGQEHIAQAIEGALAKGTPAHAYLFSGTRGTGKTTTARIIARALGTSDSDTYEIDAASNNGVDDIRDLRENVGTLPFDSKYKVYIIDEVHMLSKGAFNALLKTLEEPPAHVVFILCTTELEKVPDTIVSRCQSFVFRTPSEAVLRELIEKTAKKEKITLGKGAADLIAIIAGGSFRDALGMLQKLASATSGTVTSDDVAQIAGAPQPVLVRAIVDAIARGSLPEALAQVQEARVQNFSFAVLLDLVIVSMRRVLLCRVAPAVSKAELSGTSDEEQAFIESLTKVQSAHLNSAALLALLDAASKQRYASIESLPLELALIKILGEA
jgi:DNA polymerase-3 subunit gamma/tau